MAGLQPRNSEYFGTVLVCCARIVEQILYGVERRCSGTVGHDHMSVK